MVGRLFWDGLFSGGYRDAWLREIHSKDSCREYNLSCFHCFFIGKTPRSEQRIYDYTVPHNMFLYWLIVVPYEAAVASFGEGCPSAIPTGGVFVKSTATTFGANARTDRPKYIQQE